MASAFEIIFEMLLFPAVGIIVTLFVIQPQFPPAVLIAAFILLYTGFSGLKRYNLGLLATGSIIFLLLILSLFTSLVFSVLNRFFHITYDNPTLLVSSALVLFIIVLLVVPIKIKKSEPYTIPMSITARGTWWFPLGTPNANPLNEWICKNVMCPECKTPVSRCVCSYKIEAVSYLRGVGPMAECEVWCSKCNKKYQIKEMWGLLSHRLVFIS